MNLGIWLVLLFAAAAFIAGFGIGSFNPMPSPLCAPDESFLDCVRAWQPLIAAVAAVFVAAATILVMQRQVGATVEEGRRNRNAAVNAALLGALRETRDNIRELNAYAVSVDGNIPDHTKIQMFGFVQRSLISGDVRQLAGAHPLTRRLLEEFDQAAIAVVGFLLEWNQTGDWGFIQEHYFECVRRFAAFVDFCIDNIVADAGKSHVGIGELFDRSLTSRADLDRELWDGYLLN